MASRISFLSDHFRNSKVLSPRLVEFIVLICARADGSDYEWSAHLPMALAAGVQPEVAEAIAIEAMPQGLSPQERSIYDLLTELASTGAVSDAVFERSVAVLGEQAVVETVALSGFYTMVARILSVAKVGAPAGGQPLPALQEEG